MSAFVPVVGENGIAVTMLRFNTFFTVVLTFFAFLLAFGGGLLTAIRLTMPLDAQVAAPAPRMIELSPRLFPGQPARERVSLVLPLDAELVIDAETGEVISAPVGRWRYW